MRRYFHAPGYILDGTLNQNCGRIILYDGLILVSRNVANDHNDLLRAFARRYNFESGNVISNAIRMYYKYIPEEEAYVICGVHRIDDELFLKDSEIYSILIKEELK